MTADHIHQMFMNFGAPVWLTYAGRLVFPLFLFASAEGFHYTRSRKKYLQRLLYAGWAMTLMSFVVQFAFPNETIVLMNNAFMTLFLAGLYMWLWDRFFNGLREKRYKTVVTSVLLALAPVVASLLPLLIVEYTLDVLSLHMVRGLLVLSMLIPNVLLVEGGILMVLLGLAFYVFRRWRIAQVVVLLLLSVAIYLQGDSVQPFMALAAIPMLLYNGEKGKGMKWFFYVYYPSHIYVFYIVSTLLAR